MDLTVDVGRPAKTGMCVSVVCSHLNSVVFV